MEAKFTAHASNGAVRHYDTLEAAMRGVTRFGTAKPWEQASDGSWHGDAWNKARTTSNAVAVYAPNAT